MPVVRERDAVTHRMHGSTFHSYVSPSSTGSRELCAWRLEVAPGTAGMPHRVSREEVFLLLDGTLTVTVDGVTSALVAGDVLLVPAGAELQAGNSSERPAVVWVTTGAGLEATLGDGSVIAPPWTR